MFSITLITLIAIVCAPRLGSTHFARDVNVLLSLSALWNVKLERRREEFTMTCLACHRMVVRMSRCRVRSGHDIVVSVDGMSLSTDC